MKKNNANIVPYTAESNKGEIVLYQPGNSLKLDVLVESETVWLTQAQIALLFDVKVPAISKHLKNIYSSGELDVESTFSILENVGNDGRQTYQTKFYSLDAILSVGYRVNSHNATMFRRWATRVLKEYVLRGYAIHQRFERIEQRVTETEKQIGFIVKTALPPKEGIFYDGQTFDAYAFVADLIKSAGKSVVLIDNYVDESTLLLLSKREKGVSATVYTAKITAQLQLDLQKHHEQYPAIRVEKFTRSHDRFLVIDDTVYLIGASLKDLGRKLFAFSKMEQKLTDILK